MIQNKYNNTAIIDADYIIWIACNPKKIYSRGIPVLKDNKFVYTDKTVEEAKETCDSYIRDVLAFTKADSYIFYLTTGTTFRYTLDNSYKANRVSMPKPLWFNEVKEHLKNEWDAIEVEGLEADDLAVITKNELSNSFIVAVDKDILNCVPGYHFDAKKGNTKFITTTPQDAEYAFAKSMLTGDSIDGIPNLEKGLGPKTAEKLLSDKMHTHSKLSPIIATLGIFVDKLGEHDGILRFYRQYRLLKIIENLAQLPKSISFTIPEPKCYNCVETHFSSEFYQITLNYDL